MIPRWGIACIHYMLTPLVILAIVGMSAVTLAQTGLEDAQKALQSGNYAEAFRRLQPLAEEGDIQAAYHLGWMYHNGYGRAIDDELAEQWWVRAAEAGNTDAQLALVLLYREGGWGVQSNLRKASRYLLMAASSGDEEAGLLLSYYIDDPDWHLEKRLAKLLRTQPESLGKLYRVTTDNVIFWDKPSVTGPQVDVVGRGEPVVLIAMRGDLAHVIYMRKRQIVWVRTDKIQPAP